MYITADQKKAIKGISIYAIANCFIQPLYHLIKGDFSWTDTIWYVGLTIAIAVVIGLFFVIGMRIPKQ